MAAIMEKLRECVARKTAALRVPCMNTVATAVRRAKSGLPDSRIVSYITPMY